MRYMVRNDEDFRCGYAILCALTTQLDECGSTHKQRKAVVEIKRSLRRYAHQNVSEYQSRIIKDYGVDGYITIRRMPDVCRSLEDAKRFFGQFLTYPYTPSEFDCTGQRYTKWFKAVQRNGGYYVYHSVGFDI